MFPTVSVLHLDMLSEENGPNNTFKTVEIGRKLLKAHLPALLNQKEEMETNAFSLTCSPGRVWLHAGTVLETPQVGVWARDGCEGVPPAALKVAWCVDVARAFKCRHGRRHGTQLPCCCTAGSVRQGRDQHIQLILPRPASRIFFSSIFVGCGTVSRRDFKLHRAGTGDRQGTGSP